jgi:colicin import membrane protein
MTETRADRWASLGWSLFLHAALIGVALLGWWQWRSPKPVGMRLAIEASVVQVERAAPLVPAPPPPDPAVDQRKLEERQAAEQQAAEQKAAEQEAAEQEAAEQRAADQRAADARAEAERKAAVQRKEEAQRKLAAQRAEQKAAADRRAAAQASAERQKREQELREQLASEERLNAARASGEQDRYVALIKARIISHWKKPPSAHAGIKCLVRVTQVPGGTVTGVQIGQCNGDASVRDSIEAAVYNSSPLPDPPSADLFERNLLFNFQPDE